MKVIHGERIGKSAVLAVVCSAAIFDSSGEKLLLTRRSDNGHWCFPGGHMEPGESAIEACAREVEEETGLIVRVGKLIAVYSSPHRIAEYADGNRFQAVVLHFEAEPIGGEVSLSDETTEVGYFSPEEMKTMELEKDHYQRVVDPFAGQEAAFLR
ncbi:MAG: NUDIX domain-containing protein [Dehalococcoidia bacterium]|jgi:8-oxo-dGTP pyrophosphatase MutT (NUDIX family)|nr:NUDIX domain-containing protein [Dehalococcoidia bacterium]